MKTFSLCFLVLPFCLFTLSRAANFAEFHVAPNGTGDYSTASPGPLSGILAKVRTVNSAMTGDVVVYLHSGTYELDSAFILRPEDSGNNGFTVIYMAFPGDTPTMSGGKRITGWTLFDTGKNIYRAVVGTSLNTRQLFINGQRAVRARGQNTPPGFAKTATGYTTTDTSMQHWNNISDIEFVGYYNWKCYRCGVASITGTTITMKQPCWDLTQAHTCCTMNAPQWIENAYELLDAPGEWYLDRSAGNLYYKPLPGENMASVEIIAPVLEMLVNGAGTVATPLHDAAFQGITFSHATWLSPSSDSGYPDVQATYMWPSSGWPVASKAPANVVFTAARNIRIERCVFTRLGGAGLSFETGCQRDLVIGNFFKDISANGIHIGNVDPSPASGEEVAHITVKDNYVTQTGAEYQDAVGIFAGYTDSAVIIHNEILNLPYTGISVGWGWNNGVHTGKNNKICYNLIRNVMQVLIDGGGIYTLSDQQNTEVSYNFVDHLGSNNALYPDEGSSNMHWHHNVLRSVPQWLQMWIGTIQNDTVDYNYHDSPNQITNGTNCVVQNNTYVTNNAWPAEALTIMVNAGLEPAYADIRPGAVHKAPVLLLRLPFNETIGTVAHDSSGNGYDGTFSAGAWTTGRLGNGLELDGTHPVSIPGPTGPMPAFSVVFWLYPHSHSDYNQAIGTGWGQFTFHTTADGSIYCGTDVSTRFTPSQLPAGTLELNQWQHFAFTYADGMATFYKNGVKLADMAQPASSDWSGFGLSNVDGVADELRIYKGGLDSASVAVLAQGRDTLYTGLGARRVMPLFSLNAANPFSSGASISFSVSKGMNTVRLAIYSVDGKLVTRLVDGKKPEGNYRVRWNATGRPTGLYVCRLEAGGKRLYKKLVLIR